jgi:tetratricopeptide (TPR) repeat protein
MTTGRKQRLGLRLWLLGCLAATSGPALSATPLGDAVELYRQKHYVEARARLEPLAAVAAPDPAACYYLGMSIFRAGGHDNLDQSKAWLGKATRLAPENEAYLAEYAGVCLLMADRDNSFSLALEGRDAMTRAIGSNPADLEAREGLMRFYAKAPWPLGDPDKALLLAAEIAKRDPKRGAAAYSSISELFEKSGRNEPALAALKAAHSLSKDPQH